MDFQKNKFSNQQKNGNGSMDRDKIKTENRLEKEINFEDEIIHLKNHLNASFDKDNIVVSEELIQKTLQAIQSGKAPLTADEENQEEYVVTEHKKRNRFPVFRLAGIAAVLLILLIGINILKYLPASKKSAEYDVNSATENTSESTAPESGTLEKSIEAKKETETYSIADTGAGQEVAKDKNADKSDLKASSRNDGSEPQEANMGTLEVEGMIFSDILPFTAEQVNSFSIINSKKESINFKEPEKIKEFLLMLDEYYLLPVENEEDTSENPLDYQIVFTTRDNLSYTILVENEILLKTDDNNRDIIRYTIIGDVEQLKSKISEYR